MDQFYKNLVREELTYFEDQGGLDHIFLWSSETYDFPSWLDYIPDSLFLSVEAGLLTYGSGRDVQVTKRWR